jgi:WD40 repeat protein
MSRIAVSLPDRIVILNTDDNTEELEIKTRAGLPSGGNKDLSFSPNNDRLISRTPHNRYLCMWDAYTGQMIWRVIEKHNATALICEWSPDGTMIAAVFGDKIYLYDPLNGDVVGVLNSGNGFAVTSLSFSSDSSVLISSSGYHNIILWDVTQKQPIENQNDRNGASMVAFSPVDDIFAIAFTDRVDIMDMSLVRVGSLDDSGGFIDSMLFFPEGDRIITNSYGPDSDYVITVWDVRTQNKLFTLDSEAGTQNAFSEFDRRMIIADPNGLISFYDMDTYEFIKAMSMGSKISSIAAQNSMVILM